MEKVGIEVLKQDVVTIAKIIGKVDFALEDGKFSLGEGLSLAIEIPKMFKLVKGYKDALAELKDLDQAEVAELNAHFAAEFDISNDKAEAVVEQIVDVIVSIAAAFLKVESI